MTMKPHGAPAIRPATFADIVSALQAGWADFRCAPLLGAAFASIFVIAGLLIAWITVATGHSYWLILMAMGFPLIGAFAALGFYEVSQRRASHQNIQMSGIVRAVWAARSGQLPWLAGTLVVLFLFWFFLGHMIFALFLGLSPMTNVSSSIEIFFTSEGISMLVVGTLVGGLFATLTYAISVLGLPMLLDRDVDFVTALIHSVSAVLAKPGVYLPWGALIAVVTFISMIPLFLGLFVVLPILGHATWHLYKRVSTSPSDAAQF